MKLPILNQVKINLLLFVKARHYWFVLGLLVGVLHIHKENGIQAPANGSKSFQLRSTINSNACTWYHDDSRECTEMLMARLPLGKNRGLVSSDDLIRRRWLFIGDSTMKRLFENSPLHGHLVVEPFESLSKKRPHQCWQQDEQMGLICQQRIADRCKLNDMFDLPYAPEWTQPDKTIFEGPMKFGLENEYCHDCGGCESTFLDCQIKNFGLASDHLGLRPCTRKRITYGGFISIEFARDVEIQTPKYRTTQENVADYLHTSWNLPGSPLVQQWGQPICVINTGPHDSMLEGYTAKEFIKNVKWYLNVMESECSHIIWLSNTAPVDISEINGREILRRQYNDEVKKLLTTSRKFKRISTYVDVFVSSLDWIHADQIHMSDLFYHRLGEYLVENFMK